MMNALLSMINQKKQLYAVFFACAISDSLAAYEFEITKVNDFVYSAIGDTSYPDDVNKGHNNNLTFVIGNKGVLVVNGGDNYKLAERLHREIKKITKLPVTHVVNENGQGHAFLGNSYWRQFNIPIIAHKDAIKAMNDNGTNVLNSMLKRNEDYGDNTKAIPATVSFDEKYKINLGELEVEIINFGHAHSPGDVSVWLPKHKLIIAGDIAFNDRLLGVFPDSDTRAWLTSFEALMALKPEVVVPGHGRPTDLATIKKYTYDYLVYLRTQAEEILDNDGGLAEAYKIDQSAWSHLDTFKELAGKNAGRIFQQVEQEYFE
ncbi:MAG: MBL fold metallo-hydrolase [Kangiellaceae bacterium]|jgi:glyoxylase-like metal-dependent hydrolase (beta-lactamase superfamily II)|nr:MBL fold metallo-hydrolase [Kangiellaceae bacterium]